LIRYSRVCGTYQDFLDIWLLVKGSYWTTSSYWVRWSHLFEIVTVATKTLLTVTEYLWHKCYSCRKHFPIHYYFMIYHRLCN
jgi:hypothetical protein